MAENEGEKKTSMKLFMGALAFICILVLIIVLVTWEERD